jgi:peptide/nickel transport system permease protein
VTFRARAPSPSIPLLAFVLRRLLLTIPTTLGVALVIFSLYHAAPGDPALVMLGDQGSGDTGAGDDNESRVDEFRRKHGLDRALAVQFLDYIGPFNLGPDGHPWFSSPRTERRTRDVLVRDPATGAQRLVAEGVPVAIEHLYETPPDERKRIEGAVRVLCNETPAVVDSGGADGSAAAHQAAWAAARATLAAAGARRALPALLTALYQRRLVAPSERAAVARLLAALAELTGATPELDAVRLAAEGQRHELRRWFAWYYSNGGARTQNTGVDKWGGLLALDLGREMQSNRPVIQELGRRLQVTVPLSLVSVLLSYLVALPLGIFSARRQGTKVDGAVTVGLFLLYSIPTFWAGLMLILTFGATGLGWLPVVGLVDKDHDSLSAAGKVWDVVLHCILPVLTLTYGSLAYLSRQMRAGMLDVIGQDYIRTARAKGLAERAVVYKHALRNSMIPVLTLLASILPVLIGGSVIVERVFDIPGMGSYAFEGLLQRDFTIVMATTLFVGIMTQLGILLSDVLYSVVDPRIRVG